MFVTKKYVSVMAEFTTDGRLFPRMLIWDDGREFSIEKILSAKKAVGMTTDDAGVRYTCIINGREKYIFYEKNKWFVECPA